ncbi:MAG: exodeoxyribonuclease VII large subunit, partial [Phycisphaerae bacterium]|nr:exodeoxyribonuclease VII large subunit [Phycisphaerae bacterium]
FPRALGVVTSATGAAIRDIQRTLKRRWPAARVYLVPVPVQGEGSAAKIAEAVRLLDAGAPRLEIDTILVARGGGSLEDLWAFNEEVLARAVAAANTPVISGVGHEVDVTICDMVSDLRAPTPTGAAELAVPDREEIRRHVGHLATRMRRNVLEKLAEGRRAMESLLRSSVFRDPAGRVRIGMQRIDELAHRLRASLHEKLAAAGRRLQPAVNRLAAQHPARLIERARRRVEHQLSRLRWVLGGRSKCAGDELAAVQRRLEKLDPVHQLRLGRQKLDALQRQLEALSYRNVLKRGFSVTRTEDGQLLRSVKKIKPNQRIQTELADGVFTSDVTKKDAPKRQTKTGNPNIPTLFD